MQRKKLFRPRVYFTASLMFVTLTAFSQTTLPSKKATDNSSRPEIIYKQEHSSTLSNESKLVADGLKLKMNLSVLEEAKAEREEKVFDPEAIPAEDIYGGMWNNARVNAYGEMVNAPDTFLVDLKNFTIPCKGYMTSNFGRRGSRRYHYGVDLKAQVGDTIYAAFDGKIRVKDYERRGYGYYLVVRHSNGLETVYGHLSKFLVEENTVVKSGQPIGLAGNTGRSFGSHLHFETRFLGKPINPNFIVDFDNKVCHRDEYLVTNASYRKTTASSKVLYNKDDVQAYAASVASAKSVSKKSADNKYVSGSVKYHRIKKGDTLGAIAIKYGVSVKKLCSLNKISARTTLRTGKSLRIA